VEPLLARYKSLLKTVSRDASLRARHAADISNVLREIEHWLAEARVAAAAAVAHTYAGTHTSEDPVAAVSALAAAVIGDDHDGDDEELEPREAWALDRLCDALLVKGALVPVSRKSVLPPPLPPSPSFARNAV
jgi:ribosomal biogenesis protein LAS1